MSIASIEIEQDRMLIDRRGQAALLFGRMVAAARRHLHGHRRLQTLRSLPDSVLIDIGVNPASVRDPFVTPHCFNLFPGGR